MKSVMNMDTAPPRYARFVIPCFLVLGILFFALDSVSESSGGVGTQSNTYDSAGRLTQVRYSDGYVLEYTYDANGNILSVELSREDVIFSDGFEMTLAYLNPLNWGK